MDGSRQFGRARSIGDGAWTTVAAVGLALAATAGVARGAVEVNVTRIGFPSLKSGDVIRYSAWVPVVVDLALVNQSGFDGFVRAGQFDIDGDLAYDRVETHLRADTGGTQRIFLYMLARDENRQDRFHVALFDEQGEGVQVVSQGVLTFRAQPAQAPEVISDDDMLILSVSDAAIGRVQDLLDVETEISLARPVHVAHIGPADLPELWIGLEMVDYIVWDDARPEDLNQRQIQALLEWIRQGGTLLIAASRTAGSLRGTEPIRAVLPVDIGAVTVAANLPVEREKLTGAPSPKNVGPKSWWETPYPDPIPLVDCTLRGGSKRIPDTSENTSTVFTRRRVGSGQVVFSGVTLRDFFSAPGRADTFFREMFQLPTQAKSDPDDSIGRQSLFSTVAGAIGFVTSGGMYLLLATMFSVAYAAAATFGSWALLGARGWRRHSWTAFAVLAGAASVLSVFGVNAVRGFGGETLRQISVVNAEAGQRQAVATTLFGLKVGTDRELDLWLPDDAVSATEPARTECFLRPLPVGNEPTVQASSFSDPETYRLEPASAVLNDVRIRATLKRLEGRWRGLLPGKVRAEVTVRGSWITEGSYVASELGVKLRDCYFLQPIRSVAGLSGPRDQLIYAFPIGDLPGDGSKIDLVERCYRPEGTETRGQWRRKCTLATMQKSWAAEFKSLIGGAYGVLSEVGIALGQEANALLLLSTVGDYDPAQNPSTIPGMRTQGTWSRDRLRRLDLRDQLEKDSGVLIGFADDPGPVRLFRRSGERPYSMITPDARRSWTMYRIRIPLTLLEADPSEEDSSDIR